MQASDVNSQTDVAIVYDGECPFCSAYVGMLRLKETAGTVDLIDARSSAPDAEWAKANYDMDEGMAVRVGRDWYHGADCVHMLSMMTTPSRFFNRLNYWVFRSPTRTRILYPVMRSGRNLALRLLGRKKIG
ncbi:MAG: DCC1-like thiol-disulfide oxidoreductase family protein [Pseudomonadota bacterium]